MNEWWNGLNVLQQVMFVIGCTTLLFMIVQIIMMLVGLGDHDTDADVDLSGLSDVSADADTDIDMDVDTDTDVDTGSEVHTSAIGVPDSDASCTGGEVCTHPNGMEHFHAFGLRLLSLRCIVTLFCFGSWTAFIFAEFLHPVISCLIGFAVGLAAAVGMAFIMGELMKLQRDGTIKIKNCIGMEGEVYLPVPAARGGCGKINVLVQEKLTEFEAVTDDDTIIGTGEKVKVLKTDGNLLVIERTKDMNLQSKAGRE